MSSILYPFDHTGTLESNLITSEQHPVTELNHRDYFYIVPYKAPFFLKNLSVRLNTGTEIRQLEEDRDYNLALPFTGATRSLGIPLYGAIVLNNLIVTGIIIVDYQTIGGDWVADHNHVISVLSEQVYNPRTTYWDVITDKAQVFPPINHEHDVQVSLYGHDQVVNALSNISAAILDRTNDASALSHMLDRNNPHFVTKEQIGLANVENYPMASLSEARDPNFLDRYINPRALNLVIDEKIRDITGQSKVIEFVRFLKDSINNTITTVTDYDLTSEEIDQLNLLRNSIVQQITNTRNLLTERLDQLDLLVNDLNRNLELANQQISTLSQALAEHVNNKSNPHMVEFINPETYFIN